MLCHGSPAVQRGVSALAQRPLWRPAKPERSVHPASHRSVSASQEDRFDLILRAIPRRGCRDGTCPDHTRRGDGFFPPDGDQWLGVWTEGPEGCDRATALVRTEVAFPRRL